MQGMAGTAGTCSDDVVNLRKVERNFKFIVNAFTMDGQLSVYAWGK